VILVGNIIFYQRRGSFFIHTYNAQLCLLLKNAAAAAEQRPDVRVLGLETPRKFSN